MLLLEVYRPLTMMLLPSFNYNKPRDELFRFGKDRSLVRIRIPKFAKIFGDGAR